jgi:uncharacterized RDD family membrane protein YckC
MPGNERLYLLKTVDGEEYGPVDQDCLVKWAENGRITPHCQIRSTLIARWEKASDVPALREILLQQVIEKAPEDTGIWSRIRTRATRRATEVVEVSGLHQVRPEDFESATLPLRILATSFDAGLAIVLGLAVYLVFALLFGTRMLDGNGAFYLGLAVFAAIFLLGSAWILAFIGQTPGQKFWGLILMKRNGEQFYLGRAYLYVVFTLLFGVLTPIIAFVSTSRRSLQEILTGTRMVKVKLIGKHR